MQGVTLLDVLHSLDPFRMKCISRIVLEHRPSGYSVRIKFASTLETGGVYEVTGPRVQTDKCDRCIRADRSRA